MEDRLINGQTGNIRHIELDEGSTGNVYVKFSDVQAGLQAMKLHYLGMKNLLIPIAKCENEIRKNKTEGINISIHQAYLIYFSISLGFYCS